MPYPTNLSEDSIKLLYDSTLNSLKYHPELRVRQAFFNNLEIISPLMADKIRSTNSDPYYDNSRIKACLLSICDKEIAEKYIDKFLKLIA